jgi:protein TonB
VVVVLHCVLLALLLTARGPDVFALRTDQIDFTLAPAAKVQQRAPHRYSGRRSGSASPPNLRSHPTPVVAPPPIVQPLQPPPMQAALNPGTGTAPTAGAADVRGSGLGSGGQGDGSGSGSGGDGGGDGGDVPPRLLKGRLKNSDYPRTAADAGAEGSVLVRYTVGKDGRASSCRVTRSSGNDELDRTTCRLIVERFRFVPSRDASGNPVDSDIVEEHSWSIAHE